MTWLPQQPSSQIFSLGNIKAGVPPIDFKHIWVEPYAFEYLYAKLCALPYKKEYNSIFRELNYIAAIQKENNKLPDLPGTITDFKKYVYEVCRDDYEKKYDTLLEDLLVLSLRLNYFYQRPRPNVLAAMCGVNIYPVLSEWLAIPCYPNPFTLGTQILLSVTDNSDKEKLLKQQEIDLLGAGWCYPSDNVCSNRIADIISGDKYFNEKLSKPE